MKTIEDHQVREWVDLELEGELDSAHRADFEAALEHSAELRAERKLLQSLHGALAESRVAVRPDFHAQVMASLPTAAWQGETRQRSAWALPLGLAGLFAAAAVLVVGLSGASAADSQVLGITAAVFDFASTTALAGAGLLFATWRGVGLGLEELFASSGLNLVAMAITVLFVNLLLFSLLRRRPAAATAEAERPPTSDRN